jgi:hypothetical protein
MGLTRRGAQPICLAWQGRVGREVVQNAIYSLLQAKSSKSLEEACWFVAKDHVVSAGTSKAMTALEIDYFFWGACQDCGANASSATRNAGITVDVNAKVSHAPFDRIPCHFDRKMLRLIRGDGQLPLAVSKTREEGLAERATGCRIDAFRTARVDCERQ